MNLKPAHWQLVRFVLVGGLNTGFSYSVYLLLLWLGLHFAWANFCATVVGIVFSFRTQGALVFRNRDWRLLRRYVLVWAFLYGVNIGCIAVLVRYGLEAYAAGAVALVPTLALSFMLQRKFVFASQPPAGAPVHAPGMSP